MTPTPNPSQTPTATKPRLPRAEWLEVIRQAPLVSIDLILQDPQGRVLLGWRNTAPARHCWFVPGGAVRKDETLDAALARISLTELGEPLRRADGQLLGVFEHHYPDNFADVDGVSTHYIVLAHQFRFTHSPQPADLQHERFQWFSPAELLSDTRVHPNVKAYFS